VIAHRLLASVRERVVVEREALLDHSPQVCLDGRLIL
jgi:hypothetical protein